ncbi:MAG: PAS domain S-box protein [Deltaproteobacteria bacterium]|nr:PAS domain S-box protein [Deltaproteobacteria bacterium]
MVRASPDAVTATDLEGRIVLVSPRTAEIHGFDSEEEMLGALSFEFVAPEDRERAGKNTIRALDEGSIGPVEYKLLRKNGSSFDGELCAAVVTGADGQPTGFVATVRDVTERKAAERDLRESEERYRNLVELLPDPVVLLQGRAYQYVSPAFTRLFGYTQEDVDAGLSFYDLVPEAEKAGVRKQYAARLAGQRVPQSYQLDLVTKDGRTIPCETSAALIQHHGEPADLVIIRDISERRRAERHLQEVQKIESLGVLAGGIAHDFNNLLVGILGNAELVARQLGAAHPTQRLVETISTSASRAAQLCEQLLAYSGRRKISLEQIDLSELVEEMSQLLAIPLSKKAHVEWILEPGLPTIRGDGGQLRQVVMNIVSNAADAVGDAEGEVVVRTRVVDCSDLWLRERGLELELEPGWHVCFEVEDSGVGMDQATLARAFEPFFTTKERGRGLGLAAVRGVVRAHAGAIHVHSEVSRGSRFRVLLPVGDAAGPAPAEPPEKASAQSPIDGKILIVDDEPMVVETIESLLLLEGIEFLSASNGQEALEIFRERRREIAALIVDLSMPRMGGEDLLRAIHELEPEMRAILTSGYDEESVGHLFADDRRVGFLQKPFRVQTLLSRLYQLVE